MQSNSHCTCLENPLRILCRCADYANIAKNFTFHSIGSQHAALSKSDIGSITSATISWVKNNIQENQEFSKPIVDNIRHLCPKIDIERTKNEWTPILPDLVSSKELRPNFSYLHRAGQNTQSSEISSLTDMLPYNGQVVKQKDIAWGNDSHSIPVKLSDKPITKYGKIQGCFSKWAEAYTCSTGYHPY